MPGRSTQARIYAARRASEWADVPRGGAEGGGTVDFKIGADSEGNLQITKTGGTGSGRGDTVWTPCEPGFPR